MNQQPQSDQPQQLAHLHVHSEYSLVDGAVRIGALLDRVKELGHDSVAITDHGNLFGAVEFYTKAKEKGINPIIGAELYVEPTKLTKQLIIDFEIDRPHPLAFSVVCLAKSKQGYHNLVKAVSAGFLQKEQQVVPIVPLERLFELQKDLFVISTCHHGELSFLIQQLKRISGRGSLELNAQSKESEQHIEALVNAVNLYRTNIDPEHFYIELVRHNFPQEDLLLDDIVKVARSFKIPIVAAANAHYLHKEDHDAHTVLLGIKNELKLSQLRHRRKNVRAYLLDNDEMTTYFSKWPDALANTSKIAQQCKVEFEFGKYFLPKIDLGTDETTEQALIRLSKEGLEKRFEQLAKVYGPKFNEDARQQYRKRLEHELEVIIKMGFPDYFLIVQDFINWAKSQGIPVGPGRGSGAGSLVAYSLRITDLDPIPYNLIFERFLNPERVSMPDFDVDFCQDRRDEVIDYVTRKYGTTNVAQITTFGKMLAKAVVRDVGRVMDLSYTKVDRIAKLIPNELGIKLGDAIEREPRLREEARKDPMIDELLQTALQLEGLSRHTSVHAAGIVISDGPMENYVPVYRSEDGSLITQFEMKNAEKVGLVKFDFLGLKTLTVIDRAVKLIKETTGDDLDITTIPLEDPKVYALISAGTSVGVFQLESSGMQQLLLKLQPNKFEDIIALVALFRPGPLQSGMVDDFVERKHGRQQITYVLEQLEPILKDTYGIIIYQEQVQKIAAVLANYSLGEADLLRRAMGKKKPEEMAKQKTRFIQGCKENNIDEKTSEELFDLMAKFAEYGFNKSHSAAYGLVSYQTAYLKAHYPAQFMAASMTCDIDNTDKIIRYVTDCRKIGITVLPPDINASKLTFHVPEANVIRFGLAAIKGVGGSSVEALITERQNNGPYTSLTDLAKRVNLHRLGKKNLELLIKAGALDTFGIARSLLLTKVSDFVRFSQNHHSAKTNGLQLLFGEEPEDDEANDEFSDLANMEPPLQKPNEALINEKKLLGMFLSQHPITLFKKDVERFANATLDELPNLAGQSDIYVVGILVDCFERTTRDGKRMMIFRIEDEKTQIQPALFEGSYPDEIPDLDSPVVCKMRVSRGYENFPPRIKLEEIMPLERFRQNKIKQVGFTVKVRSGATGSEALRQFHLIEQFKKIIHNHQGATAAKLTLKYDDKANVVLDCSNVKLALSDQFLQQFSDFSASHPENVEFSYL